ncbi:MAG: DotU/TssL family secretion system protein [Thermodesulfobacteriota bacterium]
MNLRDYGQSFLLSQFREFYAAVAMARREVLEAGAPSREGADPTAGVGGRLATLLETQALDAKRRGGDYGANYYREAQYVMAALADDIFLNLDWAGREAWKARLLEYRLFGSKVAGEQFYRKLEKLLAERDPAYAEMAALYLLALSLGFRGRFRGDEESGVLDRYRRELFSFIYHRNPALEEHGKELFPEAYAAVLGESEPRRLPHMRKWFAILALVALVLLVVSHGLWLDASADLEGVLDRILGRAAGL